MNTLNVELADFVFIKYWYFPCCLYWALSNLENFNLKFPENNHISLIYSH